MSSAPDRIAANPFYVLGLRPGCARAEVEREGQKLLAMLELGLSAARTYATPVGERERTADRVREAMAELRDPARRLGHELWARLPPSPPADPDVEEVDATATTPAPWGEALHALGWATRRAKP
jgi:hypothetical protein